MIVKRKCSVMHFRTERRLRIVASRSTRGFPPGPEPHTLAVRTAGLLAENLSWLLLFWRDDDARPHRRRRQRDHRVVQAGTERRPGRVRGRRGESRLLSHQYVPRRGTADRCYRELGDLA